MKCCHFKMTGREKRLPLLTVFKTRESHFIRNKQSHILKGAVEMKPDFSSESQSPFCHCWGKQWHTFFPVLPFLSFLSYARIWSLSMTKKPHTRFVQGFVQRNSTSVLMVKEPFFQMASHVSLHLSEKQTYLCYKKMLKEEKNVCFRKGKIRDVRGGTLGEEREC